MTIDADDPLARRLAELPDPQIDAKLSREVRRKAHAALDETRGAMVARVWSAVIVPALLVLCAMDYAVGSAQFLEQTYGSARVSANTSTSTPGL